MGIRKGMGGSSSGQRHVLAVLPLWQQQAGGFVAVPLSTPFPQLRSGEGRDFCRSGQNKPVRSTKCEGSR